jgi:recombination protein RecT
MSNGTKATAVSIDQLGNRQLSPVNELKKYLDKLKPSISAALPKHLNADRMARLVMTEFSKNAALRQCKFESIAACIMTASQLGLEIGVGGQAYMIPYKDTATLVPGWKGLVDLVARAGRSSVWTGAVFEGDVFDWELGDSPFLKHKPMGENDPDKMLFAYAIGRVNGSDHPIIECWPNKRIRKHFDKNVIPALKKNHYSNTHWEMYARKVVLLQVLKYLPQSIELQAAVDATHASDQGRSVSIDADFVTIEQQVVPETKAISESHDLPADASPRLAQWWNAMASKSDEREIAALCDEASLDTELSKAEKDLLWAESMRRQA